MLKEVYIPLILENNQSYLEGYIPSYTKIYIKNILRFDNKDYIEFDYEQYKVYKFFSYKPKVKKKIKKVKSKILSETYDMYYELQGILELKYTCKNLFEVEIMREKLLNNQKELRDLKNELKLAKIKQIKENIFF